MLLTGVRFPSPAPFYFLPFSPPVQFMPHRQLQKTTYWANGHPVSSGVIDGQIPRCPNGAKSKPSNIIDFAITPSGKANGRAFTRRVHLHSTEQPYFCYSASPS